MFLLKKLSELIKKKIDPSRGEEILLEQLLQYLKENPDGKWRTFFNGYNKRELYYLNYSIIQHTLFLFKANRQFTIKFNLKSQDILKSLVNANDLTVLYLSDYELVKLERESKFLDYFTILSQLSSAKTESDKSMYMHSFCSLAYFNIFKMKQMSENDYELWLDKGGWDKILLIKKWYIEIYNTIKYIIDMLYKSNYFTKEWFHEDIKFT
ncbi:MAG: hypothetical protein H8D45_25325 [Bacteroidetes bacterium]|nr:hypothetical protein [Bacteroidota bacterium]